METVVAGLLKWGGECGRHRSSERLGNNVNIMDDHADVGSFGRALGAHGIAVELAADYKLVTTGGGSFDERIDSLSRHAALDEDGGNFVAHERIDELINILQAGFAIGADALHAEHCEIVSPSEVTESIVGRDHHAAGGGDRGEGGCGVRVKVGETRGVGERVGGVEVLARGIFFDEHVADAGASLGPQRNIEPDMRIKVACELGRLAKEGFVDGGGDLQYGLLGSKASKEVSEAAFKVKAAVENYVGIGEDADVAR